MLELWVAETLCHVLGGHGLLYTALNAINIGLNGKFLRFRRDGVSISYTVICLSHLDVCLAIT
jgi:hypothetical protein